MANERSRVSWPTVLERISVVLVILTASVLLVRLLGLSGETVDDSRLRVEPPVPEAPVSLEGRWIRGSAAAQVGMIVFGDFECGACAHFATTALLKVEKKYVESGQVRIAYWHRPLDRHARAVPAAKAADCAGRQGKFWPMHDLLYQNQRNLDDENLERLAERAGVRSFAECFSGSEGVTIAGAQLDELQVRATPTVFVGRFQPDGRLAVTERWSGSRPFDKVAAALEELLTQQK